jgi:hypothetical protein
VGLHFLHSFSSTMIHGIARDAKRIVDTIAARSRTAPAVSRHEGSGTPSDRSDAGVVRAGGTV